MSDRTQTFRAVQEHAAAFHMDWPVAVDDSASPAGTVFILTADGLAVTDFPWRGADEDADESLGKIGWARAGPWHNDEWGRRAAYIIPTGEPGRPVLPSQRQHEDRPERRRHSTALDVACARHAPGGP